MREAMGRRGVMPAALGLVCGGGGRHAFKRHEAPRSGTPRASGTPAMPQTRAAPISSGFHMLILRVSGIKKRLRRNATAGTTMG
jgi:hypothetical protein